MAKITDLVESVARVGDYVAGTVIRGGQVVGFSESARDGRYAVVDRLPDGTLDHRFTGPTPTNETGAEETCSLLLRWWSRDGAVWRLLSTDPLPPDVDAVGERVEGDRTVERVQFQVVRAMVDQDFWREAGQQGEVGRQDSTGALVDLLEGPIQKKARNIPPRYRPGFVLVLDALDTPALAFPDVVEAFRATHGDWVRSLGFAQVWIVGQAAGTILRID